MDCFVSDGCWRRSVAAQTTPEQKPEEALRIVKSQSVSKAFYDALKSQETPVSTMFDLTRAFFNEQNSGLDSIRTGDFEKWHMMDFRDGKNRTRISIFEYETPELASKALNAFGHSTASVAAGKEFGDESFRGYNGDGQFLGMRFRKNEFTVHISSQSETTVKAFAESALKAIEAK
jgi:hypothetical protein